MIDGAKEINKDDDNKSIYWGKKIMYYKKGNMKSKSLFDFDGKLIYKKKWYSNGNIKSFYYETPGTNSSVVIEYNENGSIGLSKMTDNEGNVDPRTFIQEDGKYFTLYKEDFKTSENSDLWKSGDEETLNSFQEGKGYSIISKENIFNKKILPLIDYYNDYSLDVEIKIESNNKKSLSGIIFNYFDRNNYSCFGINSSGEYGIFHIINDKTSFEIVPIIEENLIQKKKNLIGLERKNNDLFFIINGKKVYKTYDDNNLLMTFGLFSAEGTKEMIVSSFDLAYIGYFMKLSEDAMEVDGALGNGTAFMIDERGYMVTNNHVIKEARYIEVEFTWDGKIKTFPAKVVAVDKENDLAIIRIISNDFKTNGSLPFSILKDNIMVGSEVFTLGYPEALSIMGKEVKFTDGKISALSGIKNNKQVYQTTIPARGGNSGGAVFDQNGNIVGVLSSVRRGSDIVSYAIKSSVLTSFINTFYSDLVLTRPINLSKLPLTSKIKTLSNHVALVKIW